MEPGMKILVWGGLANLVYGFLTGFLFAQARGSSEFAPRYLVMAHVGPLMQGTMLLALTAAIPLILLPGTAMTLGCALLVLSSACFAIKDTINWHLGVTDEFRQRPAIPRLLALTGAPIATMGLLILVVGAIRGI